MSKLNRITQLTGFSDPVYAEAVVTVHQFDILLNVLVVNQSNSTLQNLTLELATVGDLKLCERPQSYTVAPFGSVNIKANIKVCVFNKNTNPQRSHLLKLELFLETLYMM